MSWSVFVRPRAEADLQEAWSWYESQRAGLGDEFLLAVDASIEQLRNDPNRKPFYYGGFYRVEGDRVLVFRVLHAKQDHRRQL